MQNACNARGTPPPISRYLFKNRSMKLELAVYVNPLNNELPRLPAPTSPVFLGTWNVEGGEEGNGSALNLGKFSASAGSVIIG